jgi:circadian clock protein KaiB
MGMPKKSPKEPGAAAKKRAAPRRKTAGMVDSAQEFEALLRSTRKGDRYVLKLYVTGSSLRSAQAIANIKTLCEQRLAGRYDLEVVDIYQQPDEAQGDQIIAAPTLVKQLPKPVRRLVGDLGDQEKVIVGLNLQLEAAHAGTTHWLKL